MQSDLPHARTDTHTRDTNLLAPPLELVEQGGDLPGAGAAERVAEGDGAALGVDLLLGQAQLVGAPQALAGEGLVDLEDVDVVLGDAGELEDLGDGLPGTDAHEQWRDADDAGRHVLAKDGLAQALGGAALHQQHGGGAVADLRGVAGVDAAVLGEGRLDLAQGLGGDARAHTVVLVHDNLLGLTRLGVLELGLEWQDLLLEQTLLLGLEGLLVGAGGEGILTGTGDVAVLGHLLGQDSHGNLAVGGLRVGLEEF